MSTVSSFLERKPFKVDYTVDHTAIYARTLFPSVSKEVENRTLQEPWIYCVGLGRLMQARLAETWPTRSQLHTNF